MFCLGEVGLCVFPVPYTACAEDADCSPLETCVATELHKVCALTGCSRDFDCPLGEIFDDPRAFCEDADGDGQRECLLSCRFDEECPPGMQCVDGLFCSFPSFLDLGLTVVDLETGLEWAKSDDAGGLTDKDESYTWSATGVDSDGTVFTDYIDGLNDATYAGHRDWRLPTSAGSDSLPSGLEPELESILDCSFSPCINPLFGPPTSEAYWSSAEFGDSSAWIGVVDTGAVVADGKTNRYGARAVRNTGNECFGRVDGRTCDAGVDGVVRTCEFGDYGTCVPMEFSFPRFVDNFDGTVTDRQTCLVWEKKTGTVGPLVSCSDLATCPDPHHVNNVYTWSSTGTAFDGEALALFLDVLNDVAGGGRSCFADHCDWRLPSQEGRNPPMTGPTELEDILAMPFPCETSPCIDSIFGPTVSSSYWSSSPNAISPFSAWAVSFSSGNVGDGNKTDGGYVRAVRGDP